MKIQIKFPMPEYAMEPFPSVRLGDVPNGRIVKVKTGAGNLLYILRTEDNGDKYLWLWPNAKAVGIEARKVLETSIADWQVELLPEKTKIIFVC